MIPAILGGVSIAGLATLAGWNMMSPTSQLYGNTFIGLRPGSKCMALTYDDGPNDPYTLQMLDVLLRHGVKATFFLIGRFVRQRPDIARMVVEAGHAVGSHTWDHPNLIYATQAEVRRQLELTHKAILDATGVDAKLFRPLWDARRPATLRTVRAFELQPVMWSVTCYDWKAASADEIVANAERQIRGGDVILLHDGRHCKMGWDRSRTVEATEHILTRYQGEGYEFVTIPEMMARNS